MIKRSVALLLSVVLTLAGCAARTPSLTAGYHASKGGPAAQAIPASYAAQLPVGREVEIRLEDGERFKATFMGLEDTAIRVQRSGRIPVPPELIPLDKIAALRVAGGGMSAAKALALGIAAGAATFFGILLVSIAAWAND